MLSLRSRAPIVFAFLICYGGVSAAEYVSPPSIFAWRDDTAAQLLRVAPMIRVEVARPAEDAAHEVAVALRRIEPTQQAILLQNIGATTGPRGEAPLFPDDVRNIEAYARGGLIDFTREWSTQFWRALSGEGIKPEFILLDYEAGAGFWSLKQDFPREPESPIGAPDWTVGPIIALQRLQSLIGELPGGYAPIDFVRENQRWVFNHRAITSFNEWAYGRRVRALRMSIVQPAWDTFHEEIPSLNFTEQMRAWPGIDINNWPIAPGPISGSWSSPSTYLGTEGQRYSVQYGSQSPEFRRALNWVDCRNDVRAALAVNQNVAPWYSNPDFGRSADEDLLTHRLLWAAGLLHDRAAGISVILLWSGRAWTNDEVAFARPIFAYLRTMPVIRPLELGKLEEKQPEKALTDWFQLAAKVTRSTPRAPILKPIH